MSAAPQAGLRRAFSKMLHVSGRRVRPLLPFWLWRAQGSSGAELDRVTRISLATLLIHSAAIVIDDIEDGSEERAGHAPLHARQGTGRTFNAASALVFAALEDLHEPKLVQMAIDAISRCHAGQAIDLECHDSADVAAILTLSPQQRVDRHAACAAFKTSTLMQLPMRATAHVLGLDAASCESLAEAMAQYGVGYQILDDVKNFRPDLLGKKAYEDLPHGLKNWVCLRIMAGWSKERLETLGQVYGTSVMADLFLDDPALPDAIDEGLETGRAMVRGALAELENFCYEDESYAYLASLLERPIEDLLRSPAEDA